MIIKSMAPGVQDSATVREAKAAITDNLARSYIDPKHHDYLQPWTTGLKPAIL